MDISKFKLQTDLAIEAREMVSDDENIEIDGVKVDTYHDKDKVLKVTSVEILDKVGSDKMGKPKGKYITLECEDICENDFKINKTISMHLAKELANILKVKKGLKILVVGLGNWNVTADSLGPKVISKTIVTKHLFEHVNKDLEDTFGCVSAFIPGVMGLTGMETSEVIKGIIDKQEPNVLIVIDALAARNTNRVNTTIQITNTGINPGSGVGNKRAAITKKTMGIPVLAIGVPTVVNAITLIKDLVDKMSKLVQSEIEITEEQKFEFVKDLLDKDFEGLCVTPKEEDTVIRILRNIISDGLNIYLHKGISIDEVKEYTN